MSGVSLHQAVIALLHQLKEHGYVLVLISDINTLHVAALSKYGFWQLFPQEHRVLSYEAGISKAKNTRDILLMAAHKTGYAPEQCAFVDDIQGYVDVAESIGMKGILYHNTTDVAKDAKQLELDLRTAGFKL